MNKNIILDFWFATDNQPFWFQKNRDFDEKIRQQFLEIWQQASQGELASWRETQEGRLAEIIILDQFSRNLFRDSPQAFSQDGMALVLAQEAIAAEHFNDLPLMHRHFMLLPFMHSESKQIHVQAVDLFARYSHQSALDFEHKHKMIIDRFGRYPHRNEALGRESSEEERMFLLEEGSSF